MDGRFPSLLDERQMRKQIWHHSDIMLCVYVHVFLSASENRLCVFVCVLGFVFLGVFVYVFIFVFVFVAMRGISSAPNIFQPTQPDYMSALNHISKIHVCDTFQDLKIKIG